MNIKGDIYEAKIAPMILISFVENAFKHGAKKILVKLKLIFPLR